MELYKFTLTLLSAAGSIPLTNTTKARNSAIAKFK